MDQLAEEGNKGAQLVQATMKDPDKFIAACQLGITLGTLGLGFVGESAFADDLVALMTNSSFGTQFSAHMLGIAKGLIYFTVFVLVAFVQTVLGELLPKQITFHRAEDVAVRCAPLMQVWTTLMAPFISALEFSSNLILEFLKVPKLRHQVHSEEELKMLVTASHEEGVLEPEEEEMLHSVFDFSDTIASEVMTPRTDMITVPATATIREFVDQALQHGHSRIPIFEENLDNIFGVVHIRDGLRSFVEHKEDATVRELVRDVLIVPENKNIGDLLTEFKKTKTHMAIVVDEYGGTRGMVTLEDLLEELVGDIADEHEVVEEYVEEMEDGSVIVDARMSLYDFNERLNLKIEDEDYNTVGGHVFGKLGREPKPGDEVEVDGHILRVEESDRHRIIKLRLVKNAAPENDQEEESNGKHETNGSNKESAKTTKESAKATKEQKLGNSQSRSTKESPKSTKETKAAKENRAARDSIKPVRATREGKTPPKGAAE